MKEINLEKLELCAKAMEECGNHGAAFYIREAIQENIKLKTIKNLVDTNLD